MNILIINQPLNNRGDESAHKGLIRKLLCCIPNVHIKVLWVNANQDSVRQFRINSPLVEYINLAKGHGFWTIRDLGIRYDCKWVWKIHPTTNKILNIYKWSDYVLCAPGGICMGGFQNWTHLFFLDIARYLGKPIVYYGRSIGPFPDKTKDNREFKRISLEMLNYFCFCSLRDKRSQELANNLNVSYIPTVDSAFLDNTNGDIPNEIKAQIGDHKYIVFVPNSLIWHYAYKDRIKKETVLYFYSLLLKEIEKKYSEHLILLLPQTFNYTRPEDNDINFFYDLQDYTKDSHLQIVKDVYNSDVQQAIIKKSECMIGARYHSIVFAINQTVPFVALSYEHKIMGLLETLGKYDSMVDITSALDSDEGMKKAVKLFARILDDVSPDSTITIKAKELSNKCLKILIDNYLCKK